MHLLLIYALAQRIYQMTLVVQIEKETRTERTQSTSITDSDQIPSFFAMTLYLKLKLWKKA